MQADSFDAADREQLAARGIPLDEAIRQLRQLGSPPPFARLERPCTPGDGIERLDSNDADRLAAVARAAAREGRIRPFIPASGAATRMFKDLLAWQAQPDVPSPAALAERAAAGDASARGLATFLTDLPRFAFAAELETALAAQGLALDRCRRDGPVAPLLAALLTDAGLGYAALPKGLLQFHGSGDHAFTAFEEHLVEAAELAADASGRAALHLTVSPEHEAGFARRLAQARSRTDLAPGASWDVAFSTQRPSTDTLAAELTGQPFRDPHGRLLFRPAGHGALLPNLAGSGAEFAFIKNIDNVTVRSRKWPTYTWSRALLGRLIEARAETFALLARLRAGESAAAAAAERALAGFGRRGPWPDAAALAAALDRPMRVCGMVRNTGEPGGGPFWVRDREGQVTPQIVESAQVDLQAPGQRDAFGAATHFNPVFLACALLGAQGQPYALERFVDPETAIVTRKSAAGRELLALERPGLWNGAMAGWLTVFVEVPLEVFNPVKTVLDLLRPEHQA